MALSILNFYEISCNSFGLSDNFVDGHAYDGSEEYFFLIQRPKQKTQLWNVFMVFDPTTYYLILASILAVTLTFCLIVFADRKDWLVKILNNVHYFLNSIEFHRGRGYQI